jgi:predicted transcriptional regulator
MTHKVTVVKIRKEASGNVNQELQWLGNSLGLFNLRDKDSSCFRVFITLVKRAKRNTPVTSDDVADRLNLSRGTVVHHLNKLRNSGIVVKERNGYLLREANLQDMIKDLQRDMEGVFSQLKDVAKEIDGKLGQ